MDNKLYTIINTINLEPIIVKAMSEEGYKWNLPYTCRVAEEYKRFLILCIQHPEEAVVPSNIVDDFWHLHILDTQKYAEDCYRFIGYFLHHFPYFGMRGEQDEKNLETAWINTLSLYEKEFGIPAPKEFWPKSNRCPNCAKRSIELTLDKRPSLQDSNLLTV